MAGVCCFFKFFHFFQKNTPPTNSQPKVRAIGPKPTVEVKPLGVGETLGCTSPKVGDVDAVGSLNGRFLENITSRMTVRHDFFLGGILKVWEIWADCLWYYLVRTWWTWGENRLIRIPGYHLYLRLLDLIGIDCISKRVHYIICTGTSLCAL